MKKAFRVNFIFMLFYERILAPVLDLKVRDYFVSFFDAQNTETRFFLAKFHIKNKKRLYSASFDTTISIQEKPQE